ncbi:chymotrypsin family serine protease [Paenibacillus roseipurpureus]|uniref:Serine protease n=1 Tax=Paenibacillus roseopurpureus TaxID=2918901 RepID=A0AA96LTT8_9BACL|nr:hypothetical protein [Paenibacillus sp. MBLB1832]WNR46376.1 hypothetical protein MJB10_09860 [Paenibacillus sp. MBLB1832]
MATFHEALKHKNRISPVLLKRAGVMAVGVGYVDPLKPSLGASVIVYTHHKIVPSGLNSLKSTAAKLGSSVPVRFLPSGTFKSHATTAIKPKAIKITSFRGRFRPVPGGVSIGKTGPSATGTAGVIVTKNNQLFVLSNNHVLIRNNATAYSRTVQPGPADGGLPVSSRIGRAYQFVPLRKGHVNYQDSSISKPLLNRLLTPRYMRSSGLLITVPGHLISYPVGMHVVKSGRTSGYVRGTVEANNADVRVSYGGSLGTLLFRNQSVIVGNSGPVSLPGDSGSVWLRANDRFAAALNFAGTADGRRSISNPIARVMDSYGIRIAVPAAGGSFRKGSVKGTAHIGDQSYVQPLTASQRKSNRAIRVRTSN